MTTLMKEKILLLLCLFMLWHRVASDGVFQLKLLGFVNDQGLDQTGKCCTNPQSTYCLSPCRTAFRVCLTHYQSTVEDTSSCTYGRIQTPVLGENTFNPSTTPYLLDNPIEFRFTFRWPKSFSLVIDVLHESSNETQSQDRYGPSEVIISRLVKSTQVLPTKRSWTLAEPYIHRKSKLTYEYRVVCGKNQYGSECATFCRPRNDKLGHYSCNDQGERVCLPGWSKKEGGNYCTKALCPKGCDPHRGTCEKPNKCTCHNGWTGSDCSQCQIRPNCVHGTCNRPYECTCLPGWGGSFCNQDLNYCINNKPCRNGATCSNTGEGSYTCNCTQGFIGKNCQLEVNECDSNPCRNGAECVDMKGQYECVCPPQFSGPNCEIRDVTCNANRCLNGGTCMQKEKNYQCICPPQWTGPECNILASHCPEKHCHNNGSCRVTTNGFECTCQIGSIGKQCETQISKCADRMCQNNGRCAAVAANTGPCFCLRCHCLQQFSGSRCERILANSLNRGGNSHSGIFILKKSTFKTEHYVENLTETRVINLGDATKKELSSTQWLGICLGSAALVFLLLSFAVCLIYRKKKKRSHTKTQKNFNHSSDEQLEPRSMDMSLIADHSSPKPVIIRDRNFRKPSNSEARLSTTSFQQQAAEKNNLADVDHFVRSKMRPSGKSTIAANNSHCCRRYSTHFVQSVPDSFARDSEEAIPLRRPSSASFSLSVNALTAVNRPSQPNRYHERPRSLRYSSSRPPTYEEVCREKDELVRMGLHSSNGIAI